MELLDSERKSALWLKLEKHIEEQIDLRRRKNDGDLDQFATASLRGEIRALKKILSLGESQPTMEADDIV